VSAAKIVFSGTQMAFGDQDKDVRRRLTAA